MNYINKYRLATPLVTTINEDNITVMELNAVAVKKINECATVINTLTDKLAILLEQAGVSVEGEDLVVLTGNLAQIKKDSQTLQECTAQPFFDCMSALELAGCVCSHVNECARIVNELTAAVEEVEENVTFAVEGKDLVAPIEEVNI